MKMRNSLKRPVSGKTPRRNLVLVYRSPLEAETIRSSELSLPRRRGRTVPQGFRSIDLKSAHTHTWKTPTFKSRWH